MSDENMEVARQLAAQAWCEPETEMIEMDVRLAEAFAKRIAALRADLAKAREERDEALAFCPNPTARSLWERSMRDRMEADLRLRADLAKAREEAAEWRSAETFMSEQAALERAAKSAAERARDEAVAEVARLKGALESFAEQGCYYGDNCPDNAGTRHGRCGPCHARRALGRTDGEG